MVGKITWSKPFAELYNQLLLDTVGYNLIRDMKKKYSKYIFVLSERSLEKNKIVVYDDKFIFQNQIRTKFTDYITATNKGIVVNENLSTISLPSLKIKSIGWDQKVQWEFFEGYDSLTSIGSPIVSSNSTVSFLSYHKGSTYKWLDERFNIYNLNGTRRRICRDSFLSIYGISFMASIEDGGFVANAKDIHWNETQIGFVKTDSLGLVYNTDIVCDCKDFNTKDTTGIAEQQPNLNVQIFPNPANDKINVLLFHKQKASIVLLNLNGQIVKTPQVEFNSNIIDVSGLKAGVYVVEVNGESGVQVHKFVKE